MNLYSFDLNLLRVLDALLQESSTVRAGRRIGLSQPAVSAALKRLRQALGDELFIRKGQHLEPTDFALSLATPLRQTLDDLERMLNGPGQFDPSNVQERFRLSGSDYFSEMLMPRLGARIAEQAPGIFLHYVDLVPDNYVNTLETYQVDIALLPKAEMPNWVDWMSLGTSYFAVIARRGHPALEHAGLKPYDALPMDLYCSLGHILFSVEGKAHGSGDVALANVGRTRRVVMTLPSFYSVHSAVAGSDNIAMVPHEMARKLARSMELEVYATPMKIMTAEIGMIWHRRHTNAPAHKWLREQIADLMMPLDDPTPLLQGNP